MHSSCDKALLDIIKIIKAEIVIGIGGYAEKRAQFVIQSSKLPIKVIMKIQIKIDLKHIFFIFLCF